jgi:5-(carboxyamino)imidazole ribonucleotide mutase
MSAPSVVWVLGSDSDLPHVEPGFQTLEELGIPFAVRILSAHRTPDEVKALARDARDQGVKVMVGVAGGAAHLAGVLASCTNLPVIGVPVPTGFAGGLDSLLSVVQMPSGIPVATVAANKAGGRNAALLAARILALSDGRLADALDAHRGRLGASVLAKDKEVSARYQPS